jgi:acetoin:2,6-dichlorophenolindophenol oxidoreductase subunit alpha
MMASDRAASTSPGTSNVDSDRLLGHYRTMCRIRAFEEAAEQAQKEGEVRGAVHLSIGQEAVAAGVCIHLDRADVITSTHRGHGHTLAKGADPAAMMAELFGRSGGTCQGKGGSMHIADFAIGMLGANGVVAAGLPIAVGAAHAFKMRRERGRVAVCFFGDGAINRGPFLEALNWAKVYELPVLFVCEDNGFAATTLTRSMTAGEGAAARSSGIGVPAAAVDGNDCAAVDEATGAALARIRGGGGPFLLHAATYRLKGHTAVDPATYRPAAEVEARWRDDPIARCAEMLRLHGRVADTDLAAIGEAAHAEMAAAVAAARAAPWPDLDLAWTDVQDVGAPQP